VGEFVVFALGVVLEDRGVVLFLGEVFSVGVVEVPRGEVDLEEDGLGTFKEVPSERPELEGLEVF
jgi:hypothetical protein